MKGGRNYLIVRKVASTIRRSCFNEIVKTITAWKCMDLFTINQSELVITCTNGYQILFCGVDDVEKLKSITPAQGVLTDVWMEEATEFDPGDLKQLEKRLRGLSKYQKRIILSFNPIIKSHWIYTRFFKGWEDGKNVYKADGLLIVKTTYKDNRFLSPDDVLALENETDKYYFEVYSLGNWGSLGGVIFKNWTVEDCSEVRKAFDRFHVGLDFGFASDPAAGVRAHYDRKRGIVYILDEMYERGLTNDDLAKELKKRFPNEPIRCDSAEPKSIMELAQRGVCSVAATKGKDSVRHGIQWLQQQQIIIDVNCTNAKNEFSSYKWEETKDGNTLPKPVDRNNHLVDALRYALENEMHYWTEAKPKEERIKEYGEYKDMKFDFEDLAGWMSA
jgi:phage terminase large subunit